MIAGNWTTSSAFMVETDADGNSNNILEVLQSQIPRPPPLRRLKEAGPPRLVELVNSEESAASTAPSEKTSNGGDEQRGSAPTCLRLQMPGTWGPARALHFLKGLLVLGAAAIAAKRKF
jgi:hypothetical protein